MKKFLLLIFSLFFTYSLTMDECEKVYDRGAGNEEKSQEQSNTTESLREVYKKLFTMPHEILEKIFIDFNHQSASEIIEDIDVIKIGIRYVAENSIRQFTDEKFEKISTIIKSAPIYTYTRIALSIALSRLFSKYEKIHFLGIMLLNKHLSKNQKLILKFLAKEILAFEPFARYHNGYNISKTRNKDFIKHALNLTDIDDVEIIVKFLFNCGIVWPQDLVGSLVGSRNKHIISLVRFALKNGADINGLVPWNDVTPLNFCLAMLACWNNENWLNGPESDDEKLEIAPKIGRMAEKGYSKSNSPSQEVIEYNISYYQELIELLSSYLPKETCNGQSVVKANS